jgi:hypothetical protein
MKHSLLSLKLLALALNSLVTVPDVRIKAFTLLFIFKTLSISNLSLACLVLLLLLQIISN